MQRRFLVLAGVLGLLGVLAGTFGAHGLKGRIDAPQLETFETGVRYHLVHALALFGVSIALGQRASRGLNIAAWAFVIGIVLFPGALYVLLAEQALRVSRGP